MVNKLPKARSRRFSARTCFMFRAGESGLPGTERLFCQNGNREETLRTDLRSRKRLHAQGHKTPPGPRMCTWSVAARWYTGRCGVYGGGARACTGCVRGIQGYVHVFTAFTSLHGSEPTFLHRYTAFTPFPHLLHRLHHFYTVSTLFLFSCFTACSVLPRVLVYRMFYYIYVLL